MKKIENMRNKILAIIQLIVINILWIMFIFGVCFFIGWTTDIATLGWGGRMLIVCLILSGITYTVSEFKERNKE